MSFRRQFESHADGIHDLIPRDRMTTAARKLRAAYAHTPGAPFYQREFGFFTLDVWKEQGLPADVPLADLFGFDPDGLFGLWGAGWCEADLAPAFEEKILETRGEHEVWQDRSGRHVLCFKGRRNGFMPEYIAHPVTDFKTWEKHCKWRMDPNTPERFGPRFLEHVEKAKSAAA